jgi:regulator of sigma E protease
MSIITTILIFALIIFIHELGHFLVAKWSGVLVHEFSLGMGPAIFKKKKGDTLYSIRLFPIGGYVKMEGEDKESTDDRAFCKKSLFKRFLIIVAGATMNLILGLIVVLIIISSQPKLASTTIAKFKDNATSATSGLKVDDKILKINGRGVLVDNDIIYNLLSSKDGKVDFLVKRDNKKVEINDVQFKITKTASEKNLIDIDFKVYSEEKNILNILKQTGLKAVSISKLVFFSVIDLFSGKVNVNELSGPVGVAQAVSKASSASFDSLLTLFAFITINVGIFNLLPLPALDGGRLLFLFIELIRRKPVPTKYEGYIHFVGFALLMILIVTITYNDIVKLINGV